MSVVRKTVAFEIIEKRENGGRIRISTKAVDRQRDRVIPRGGQIANYELNPVVQYGHIYDAPWATVGRTIKLEVFDDYIDADFELRPAANEADPQNIVLLLWNGGWIKTASIGFQVLDAVKNAFGGYDFTEWELLEWSLVPIPANQEALRLAVKGVIPLHLNQKELSLDRLVGMVWRAVVRAIYDTYPNLDWDEWNIEGIYSDYAIAEIKLSLYRIEYSITDQGIVLQPSTAWTKVDVEYVEVESATTSVTLSLLAANYKAKAGARHSKADNESIQAIHDHAVSLGATCGEKADDDSESTSANDDEEMAADDVEKMLAAVRGLRAAFAQ